MNIRKNSYIQIPNSLLVSKASNEEVYLYTTLKTQAKDNVIEFSKGGELTKALMWKDNRTTKKYLSKLEKQGYIELLSSFSGASELKVRILPIDTSKGFTQIPRETYYQIAYGSQDIVYRGSPRNLVAHSLRLFYYYEKNYNPNYRRAFPSYTAIKEEIGLDGSYISVINNNLEDIGVLKVNRAQSAFYTNSGDIQKLPNSYIPLITRV